MNVLIFFKIDPWNYITSRGEKILEKEKQIEDEVKRKKKRKV